MISSPYRNTSPRVRVARENKRLARDRKIFGILRRSVAIAEHMHQVVDEPVEALSVFYGKQELPWQLTPFPIGVQDSGRPMPQWEDLSQWLKVMIATMLGHQWDLLTFNIHLHPDLEAQLVASGQLRAKLAERVRKHVTRVVGKREFFFVIEGAQKGTGDPVILHMHGAVCAYEPGEAQRLQEALARAAGHNVAGRRQTPRAVHTKWFEVIRVAYVDYLFKFAKKFDSRLDHKRLVMSHPMTAAARDLWIDITRPALRSTMPTP
jgi:hypothetical protein